MLAPGLFLETERRKGMRYLLVGPNEGKNLIFHGFEFRAGVCVVPDADKEALEAANRLLPQFYGAFPENQVMRGPEGLMLRQDHQPVVENRGFVDPGLGAGGKPGESDGEPDGEVQGLKKVKGKK